MLDAARRLGVAARQVPRIRTRSEALTGLPEFVRVLREERPAVFHAHLTTPIGCKYGLAAAAFLRVPAVIATVHLLLEVPPSVRYDISQRFATMCVDRYIVVSHGLTERLRARFRIPAHKIRVVPNAVPVEDFRREPDPRLRAELAGGAGPIVLTVARLESQKDHATLIEAVPRVPDARFVLVGEGGERRALESRARALGVSDRVRFLGLRGDIADLLAISDVFVLPSLYEGLPLSILEAMAAGKPVVASSIPGIDEVVVDGETGLLVPPRDPAALAASIRLLLTDSDLRVRLGDAGRERVHGTFSLERMVEGVVAVYQEALAEHRD